MKDKKIEVIRELLIRKKKLEKEISLLKKEISSLIKDIPPGAYNDVLVVEAELLRIDTNRLKNEVPDIYYKYLSPAKYKYAKLRNKKEVKNV